MYLNPNEMTKEVLEQIVELLIEFDSLRDTELSEKQPKLVAAMQALYTVADEAPETDGRTDAPVADEAA